jgi:hypothetical protein
MLALTDGNGKPERAIGSIRNLGCMVAIVLAGSGSAEAQVNSQAARAQIEQNHYSSLRNAHAADPIDAQWAGTKSAEIVSRMTALGLAAQLQVDCHTRYCLVDGQWPSTDATGETFQAFTKAWMHQEVCEFHVLDMSLVDVSDSHRFVVVVRCER